MAFFESLINTINKGNMMGRLRIAMSVKLLLVLEAIAETIVNSDEKPKLPKKSVSKNRPES